MSRIVIDAREYSTSTGRYVSKLIANLEQIDQENDYLILLKSKDMAKCQLTNPRFSKIESDFKEFSFMGQLGFAWQLYRLKADLVHFTMVQQPLLYWKSSITTIHDLTTARFTNPDKNPKVFYIKQQIYKLVIWWAAHKSKRVIVPSNWVRKDLSSFAKINDSKEVVTYEGADHISEPAVAIKELNGKHFMMYVGRPTPHKNLWVLIEAFSSLKAMYPDLYLVLAGKFDRNYSNIKRRASSNGIGDIIFTDYISEGELRWLYENCQVYAFPSLSEGFGLPGLEAMAHGAPVVAARASCLPEIYGQAAHYFDPTDKFSIAKALTDVINSPKLRERLVSRGYKQVKRYSWEEMAKKTLAIYQETK